MFCKNCASKVVKTDEIRETRCHLCGELFQYSQRPTPMFCKRCSRGSHQCESCASPLADDEMKINEEFAELSKTMSLEDARKYGFSEAMNLGLEIAAPHMYVPDLDPQKDEDKAEAARLFEFGVNMHREFAEENAFAEVAKAFGIKRWDSSSKFIKLRGKSNKEILINVADQLYKSVAQKGKVKMDEAAENTSNETVCKMLTKILVECFGMEEIEAVELTNSKLAEAGETQPIDELIKRATAVIKEQINK